MLLDALLLSNFKAFSDRQNIRLAPITLIFGPNSAGKSSLIQSLLMLKQTLEESEHSESPIKPKGDLVDLGNFYRFVNNHDLSKAVEIALILSERALISTQIPSLRRFPLSSAGIGITLSQQLGETDVSLSEIQVYLNRFDIPVFGLKQAPNREAIRARYLGPSSDRPELPGTLYQLGELNSSHNIWAEHLSTIQNPTINRAIAEIDENLAKLEQIEPNKSPDMRRLTGAARELLRIANLDLEDGPKSRPTAQELRRALTEIRSQLVTLSTSPAEYMRLIARNQSSRLVELRDFLPFDSIVYRVRDEDYVAPTDAFRYLSLLGPSARMAPLNPMLLATSISAALRKILVQAVYLGPLREYPERHYIYSGSKPKGVGKSGKLMADTLFANSTIVHATNERLVSFGIPYKLDLRLYRDTESQINTADVFSLHLTDTRNDTEVGLIDVGFGVSQVLPIIVQCMLSSDSLIMIEQPELHLHPALQTELANLLVDSASPPLNNQLIVETHSEHLILRIQSLIRNGDVHPDMVSVLYVQPTATGSCCLQLRIDEEGDFIDEWPGGFFEESYRELFA